MKKLFLSILLLLTIANGSNVFSQTKSSNTVKTDQTIAFLIIENEKANDLIFAQAARIETLETELAAEKENSNSISKSYELSLREISLLKQSNDALTRAVELNEQTIAALSTDRDKWRTEAKKQKKGKYKAIVVAASAIAFKLLIP